ncbi:Dihydrolipoamide acetyltransferase component of pyruvate dehydrogenase complex [hydrothermal vent metagenome]|uniref:Dihydrolipoamide acetyltransferase component of pyruvate dehydrogenase complex n=1 Tax=hydrothermal vent metagenome TaxID=652676 RepID=A0A3B1CB92_9ZZZZ
MKIDVIMPKMGESINEGTVIKWHKKVGDRVKKDEIIFEIATDKVDTEIPSPADGVLTEIIVNEQETVDVDTIVAVIDSEGEGQVEPSSVKPTPVVSEKKEEKKIETKVVKTIKPERQEEKIDLSDTNRFYSPLVLNIARKENVSLSELEKIHGTGVGSRVSKRDILNYIENKKPGAEQETSTSEVHVAEPSSVQSFGNNETEIIPMDNIRLRIMEHMIRSRDTSVHVTAVNEVDMSKVHNYIKSHKDELWAKEKVKLTYMSFISYACVNAIKEFPLINASIDGKNIVMKKFINLGIAVAVEPNGLIVPNIKNAENLNVRGFAKGIAVLSDNARNKKLSPDDIMNGTFSITNYGVFGLQFGTPIINQPEVAILGVGAVIKKPVVVEVDGVDSITIKPMMYLSISHDHRLVDGMLGGKFLKSVKDHLENFDVSMV